MSLSEYVKREDLVCLFHLPMKEASKKLGLSESSLRNICRKHGVDRWPYRKFQQLDAHIESLKSVIQQHEMMKQGDNEECVRTNEMIHSLSRARKILEQSPNIGLELAIIQANKIEQQQQNGNYSQYQAQDILMFNTHNSITSSKKEPSDVYNTSSFHDRQQNHHHYNQQKQYEKYEKKDCENRSHHQCNSNSQIRDSPIHDLQHRNYSTVNFYDTTSCNSLPSFHHFPHNQIQTYQQQLNQTHNPQTQSTNNCNSQESESTYNPKNNFYPKEVLPLPPKQNSSNVQSPK